MLIRFISALMFMTAGTLTGVYMSEKLKSEKEICRQTAELMRTASLQIRYQGTDVYELCSKLKDSRTLNMLAFLKELPEKYSEDENFHIQWKNAVKAQGMKKDIADILCRFGDILGSSDIEGQLEEIAVLEEETELLEKERAEEYRKRGKLFRSAGVLFGAMAAVIVI